MTREKTKSIAWQLLLGLIISPAMATLFIGILAQKGLESQGLDPQDLKDGIRYMNYAKDTLEPTIWRLNGKHARGFSVGPRYNKEKGIIEYRGVDMETGNRWYREMNQYPNGTAWAGYWYYIDRDTRNAVLLKDFHL